MRHPPSTVERAFELACDVEKQLQVADSFKLEFPAYNSREVNENQCRRIIWRRTRDKRNLKEKVGKQFKPSWPKTPKFQ